MIEKIIYTVTLYEKPFLVVSTVVLFIGAILYYLTKKFDINKKSTRYLGLLTRTKQNTNHTALSNSDTNDTYYLCINCKTR